MRRIVFLTLVLSAALASSARAGAGYPALVDQRTPAAPVGSSTATFNASGYRGETADDFVVPEGEQWTIYQTLSLGLSYAVGAASEPTRVRVYTDAGGLPSATTVLDQTVTGTMTSSSLFTNLAAGESLKPGHYWLSVQTQGPATSDEWFSSYRAAKSGYEAAWRDPAGVSCGGVWGPRGYCLTGGQYPDQLFMIGGVSAPYTAPGGGTTTTTTTTPGTTETIPVTPTVKPTTPTFAAFLTLPSAKSCRSKRNLTLHLRKLKDATVAKAVVKIAGKTAKTVKGKALTAAVDLRGLPKGSYKVEIQLTLADGKVVKGTRTYKTCAAKKSKKK